MSESTPNTQAACDRQAYETLLMMWADCRNAPGTQLVMSDALYHALRDAWLAAGIEEVTTEPR